MKAKEEKEKELQKRIDEDPRLIIVNQKRDICKKIGFEENTEKMANCILELMLEE